MGDLSDCLLRGPSIEFFRASVPVDDGACGIAHNNGIMGKFNELGAYLRDLFTQMYFLLGLLAL